MRTHKNFGIIMTALVITVICSTSAVYATDIGSDIIQIGADGTDGQLSLYSEQGGTDYEATFQPHVAMTQDTNYILPADDGTNSQMLSTDGNGALIWASSASPDFSDSGEAGGADRTLGNTDDYDIGFLTNNLNRLHIQNDGNVGVGTTSPSTNLHIVGGARVTGLVSCDTVDTDANGVLSCGTDATGSAGFSDSGEAGGADRTLGNTDDYDIGFLTNNLNRLHIQNDGNVGVGTTSPRTKLELGGDGAFLATGTHGSGWTEPDLGAGTRMMWYPKKSAFRAGNVGGIGWDDSRIGEYSVAMGRNTGAEGSASFAMGYGAYAKGVYSTAMGINTYTTGHASTAMGSYTTASGNYSTAMGNSTTASGSSSTAMGQGIEAGADFVVAIALNNQTGTDCNQDNSMCIMGGNVGVGTTSPSTNLHIVGGARVTGLVSCDTVDTDANGVLSCGTDATGSAGFSDSGEAGGADRTLGNTDNYDLGFLTNNLNRLHIQNDGNVGVGTTSPRTKLELGDDGAFLAIGTHGSGWTEPNLGAGTRMMWYPKKSAFRVGATGGTGWDDSRIGEYSVAMGKSSASGNYSFAVGDSSSASGAVSTAMGRSATASGIYSTAMGNYATASGTYSTAMGYQTTASGFTSTAMGQGIEAGADNVVAIGLNDQTGTDCNQNNSMCIMGGNVGIGTTGPGAELEIDGGIRLNPNNASKPSCDTSHRGELWFTVSGAGVTDTLEVCGKDAGDAYAWRTLW